MIRNESDAPTRKYGAGPWHIGKISCRYPKSDSLRSTERRTHQEQWPIGMAKEIQRNLCYRGALMMIIIIRTFPIKRGLDQTTFLLIKKPLGRIK